MHKKVIIYILSAFLLFFNLKMHGQRFKFSTETDTSYLNELHVFLQKSYKQEITEQAFTVFSGLWNSGRINANQKALIIQLSNNMLKKHSNPYPHFYDFISLYNSLLNNDNQQSNILKWTAALEYYSKQKNYNAAKINRLINSVHLFVDSMSFFENRAVKWKYDAENYQVVFNETEGLRIDFNKTNLICYSKRDSFLVYNTHGSYLLPKNYWIGKGGIISWERANFSKDSVYAKLSDYRMNFTKPELKADSVEFTNKYYFKGEISGYLHERIVAGATGEKATYPQFTSYELRVDLPNVVKNVDYTGGFFMRGAKFIGQGDDQEKALVQFRNGNEIRARVEAASFSFTNKRIAANNAYIALYIQDDSIYTPDINLNFLIDTQLVVLTNSRLDEIQSVFVDTYHDLDINVRQISFALRDTIITFRSLPASTYRTAIFRSYNFFTIDEYNRLALMDNVHPLEAINRMVKSGMFIFGPVQLASYLEKDIKYTRQLMIILAKKGFIHYDYNAQVAYAEQKLFDYVEARHKIKDYDEIEIISKPKKIINAELNINTGVLSIYGVKPFAVSNNRRVGILPKNGIIRVKENMEIDFDGKLRAGLADMYGQGMTFYYDSFMVNLQQIDSLKLTYQSDKKNEDSLYTYSPVASVVENLSGILRIDQAENKSGNITYPEYPILENRDTAYVFYDKNNQQDTVYKRDKVQFTAYPFVLDSLNTITRKNVNIHGMFKSGGIFPDFEENLTVQPDSSLGFVHHLDSVSAPLFNGLGYYENTITLNNKGLKGNGKVHFLNAHVYSEEFIFYPDSMNTYSSRLEMDKQMSDTLKTEYPLAYADSTYVHWEPGRDQMLIKSIDTIQMYDDIAEFTGTLELRPDILAGKGDLSFKNAYLNSNSFTFNAEKFKTDTSDFNLQEDEFGRIPLLTHNVAANVDFSNNIGLFTSVGDSSYINFPDNQYLCYMNFFTWYMGVDLIDIGTLERLKTDTLITNIDELEALTNKYRINSETDYQVSLEDTTFTPEELMASSKFVSTRQGQDSLSFIARSSSYDIENHLITAKGVKLIKVADAHIYPDAPVFIEKNANIRPFNNARIVATTSARYHKFYSATVKIYGAKNYGASADYEYYDRTDSMSIIHFDTLYVDKNLQSIAFGKIADKDKFKLSPEFSYYGNVEIEAQRKFLNFNGYLKIHHNCGHRLDSLWLAFNTDINPDSIIIPLPEVPKDVHKRKLYAAVFNTNDSLGVYPAFMTTRKKFADKPLFEAKGLLYYNDSTGYYEVTDSAKFVNKEKEGNYMAMHKSLCIALGEGKFTFPLDLGQVKLISAGKFRYNMESMSIGMDLMLGVNFYFDEDALNYMADKLNQSYELDPVDVTNKTYQTAFKELVGLEKSKSMLNDIALMGGFTSLPDEMDKSIFFSQVEMEWNRTRKSFLSKGKIGIGSIKGNSINKMVDGYIELAPRRTGDIINIYIALDKKNWFFFTYTRGTMKSVSSYDDFNDYIVNLKDKERKPPVKDEDNPYMFFPGSERSKDNFLTQIAIALSTNEEKGDFNYDHQLENSSDKEEVETETEEYEEESEEETEPEIILEEAENQEEQLLEENTKEVTQKQKLENDTTKINNENPKKNIKNINNKVNKTENNENLEKNKEKKAIKEEQELSEEEELLEEELLEEEGGGGI